MNSSIKDNIWLLGSLLFLALLLGFAFSDGLIYMEKTWQREEYSHGYLIPVISFWFVWQNREQLNKLTELGSWVGVIVVMAGLGLGLMGELATLFVISQYAFLITLFGLCFSYIGWKGVKFLWFPLAYLVFMVPLPNFLYNNLSSQLQLISSGIGVAVIRLFDISVFLQGNVIDLGNFQLQVVEACSGLRYLFPLTSFGFLCAYMFRVQWWMRAIIFLSTIPITVLMNSLRIGIIGVLVEYWGIEQAEGFLHDFEGWIIFVGCLVVLFSEMWLLTKLFVRDKSFSDVFIVDGKIPVTHDVAEFHSSVDSGLTARADIIGNKEGLLFGLPKSYLTACAIILLVLPLSISISGREEIQPQRLRFTTFPLVIEDWHGVEVGMGQNFIDVLKFDDYIIGNYSQKNGQTPVNFYVAYYASQRKGASAHSPKSCLPGDGWRIGEFSQKHIASVLATDGQSLMVNRALITKGENKQLVYYWFQQRGRVITNEYLVKWYLFWDALTRQRTDGALIRLVLPIAAGEEPEAADKRLELFLRTVYPKLENYIPG